MELEPRTDAVHREILGMLPPNLMDFTDLEGGISQLMAMLGAAPVELPDGIEVADHHTVTTDGHELLVRSYRPSEVGTSAPALYWMHGGGMILGSVAMDDAHCAALASSLGIIVASVEYRLAPAFPYPTPLDDCYSGLAWLFGSAADLGVDPERIAIGGGSAGAGLAAGLALMARDRGEFRPCFQLLKYPMIDDRNETPSSHAIVDLRVWNRSANLVGWSSYLDGRAGSSEIPVYAAPARATDLTGLPPALVTVGDLDMFLDEDIAYAQALLRAGVPTELHVYPGAFHGSDVMVPHADTSQRWRRDELSALRRAFGLDA
jgi:acetyl esterase/lipase